MKADIWGGQGMLSDTCSPHLAACGGVLLKAELSHVLPSSVGWGTKPRCLQGLVLGSRTTSSLILLPLWYFACPKQMEQLSSSRQVPAPSHETLQHSVFCVVVGFFIYLFIFHHKTDLSIILKIERLTNKSPAGSSQGQRPLGTAAGLSRGDPTAEHPCSVRMVLGHTTRMGAPGQQPAGAALRTETLTQGLRGVKRKLNVQQPRSSAGRSPASPLVAQRGSVGALEMALGKKNKSNV